MSRNWIFDSRLPLFLEALGYIAGCRIDHSDTEAITGGIRGTSDEDDRWFDYELHGNKRVIRLRFADDPGTSVLHVQVETQPPNADEVIGLAFLCASISS